MIYLKQSFNIHPASPATRDAFVEAIGNDLLPANESHGARLVAGFFCFEEWFSQIVHVTEFDDLSAYAAWRDAARAEAKLAQAVSRLKELAPERRAELLEPLGAIGPERLAQAIEQAKTDPAGAYTFAILEVAPGRMSDFAKLVGGAAPQLPILTCWRDVAGNPDRVVDLWRGDQGGRPYAPTNDGLDAFFGPLRELAPRERMMRLLPLPYSPLA